MSTIDMSKVAGFKAVDSEGNEMGIVSMNDIVDAVKSSINQQGLVAARQISTLAATSTLADTSTLAAKDSYENELSEKTDVTWIRGLDADGNSILISKQSLSSVLEELLESSGAYPFMYRGRIRGDEGGDVNALTLSGIYNLFDVGINIPDTGDAYPMNYSILKVYNAGGIILQEITNHNYSYLNHVYIRISPDNGLKWYDWRKIL